MRGLLALLLLLTAVLVAWLSSNWRDADPQPRPVELALPQPRLSLERNTAYALMGLRAAADRDAAKVGRALWVAELQTAEQLRQGLNAADTEAALQAGAAQHLRTAGPLLANASGDPWDCDGLQDECVPRYLAKTDVLAQQRQLMAVQGGRCDAIFDALMEPQQPAKSALAFEEVMPAVWHPAVPVARHVSNTNTCGRWWQTGAALSYRQGRKDEALRLLARSHRFQQALQVGSQTLQAQMVALGVARRHLGFISGLAAQSPDWAPDLLPLVTAAEPPEQQARRWVVVESALAYASLKAVGAGADAAQTAQTAQAGQTASAGAADESASWPGRALDRLVDWLQMHQIGWHPERSAQLLDQQRLRLLQQVDAGLPEALKAQRGFDARYGHPLLWAWRNPIGHAVVETSNGHFGSYMRRQLDLELHREAAAMALNAQRLKIAPAARAAWALQQPATPALQGRISWSADGRTLTVRSWAEDGLAAGQPPQPPVRIAITLDRGAAP